MMPDPDERAPPPRVMIREPAAPPRVVLRDPEDELSSVISRVRRAVLAHPVAAQALFEAFVAEGRRFAATPEGRRWRAELAGSDLIRRARLVCEACALSACGERAATTPSDLLDAVALAMSVEGLEPVLSSLSGPGEEGADADPDPR